MTPEELFAMGLGLSSPWLVVSSRIENEELHIELDFEPGARFSGRPVHDTVPRTWRHLNFWQYPTYLHVRTPRVVGSDGKVSLVDVPWARPGSGFTALFEALALAMMRSMPVSQVARHLQVDDMALWRLLEITVEDARRRARFTQVRRVGVEETACRRGHDYITQFADLDTGRVLFVCRGRAALALQSFERDLKLHAGDPREITTFACDMSAAFLSGIAAYFPGASVVLDRFHLIQLLGRAVDEARRREGGTPRGMRFLLMKNPEGLGQDQTDALQSFLEKDAFVKTAESYRLRLAFQELFRLSKERAVDYLDAWIKAAQASAVGAMRSVARTFERHRDKILAWFDHGVSNGRLEGLNGVLQSVKARARGYANPNHMILISYLLHGQLDLTPDAIRTIRRKRMSTTLTH